MSRIQKMSTVSAMRRMRVLASAGLALALSACAVNPPAPNLPRGALDPQVMRSQLQIGVTTKAQVEKTMGKGSATKFDNGFEVWVYDDRHAIPELLHWLPVIGNATAVVEATSNVHELAILFDRDGVVRKYQLREKPSPVRELAGK